MSRSRSPTPKPNTIASSSSTSRPVTTHDVPSPPPVGQRSTHPRPATADATPDKAPSNPSSEEGSSTPTMARQLRARSQQSQTTERRDDDSASSSSQGEADDAGPASEELSEIPQTAAPIKKKRTRTLTTPHQAAVLHALLAESRFPTTTMREEVGRSIGLSARKVQIWFQNQRQKARRPRSSGATHAETHSAQYGVFPNLTLDSTRVYPPTMPEQGSSSGGSSRSYHSMVSFEEQQQTPPLEASRLFEHYAAPGESSYKLVGPGIPGSREDSSHNVPPIRTPPPMYRSPRSTRRQHPYQEHASEDPQSPFLRPLPGSAARPVFSRTLPPLVFDQPSGSRIFPGPLSTTRVATRGGHDEPFTRVSPTDSLFAHRPPEQTPHLQRPTVPLPLVIPPPFTLQPQPQWDHHAPFATSSRPHSSPWYHASFSFPPIHSSAPPRASSGNLPRDYPTVDDRYSLRLPPLPTMSERRSSDTDALARAGRYDPVRASFMRSSEPLEEERMDDSVSAAPSPTHD